VKTKILSAVLFCLAVVVLVLPALVPRGHRAGGAARVARP
jgi:hypothetical protein